MQKIVSEVNFDIKEKMKKVLKKVTDVLICLVKFNSNVRSQEIDIDRLL